MGRTPISSIGVFVALLIIPGRTGAQDVAWPRGDRLTVDVQLDTAILDAASLLLDIRYTIANHRASEQSANILQVEARVPVVEIRVPARQWVHVAGDSVAFWGSASRQQDIAPGASRSGFEIRARGLPGIVRFWVEGYFAVPTMSEADAERLGPQPRVEDNSFAGLTVGVVLVEDLTVGGLLSRLRGLEAQACTLGWITNRGVCHSLAKKLDHAARALARGRPDEAKRRLKSFLRELAAQHRARPDEQEEEEEEEHEGQHHEREAEPERERGKHVTDNAFWLLKINAEYLLSRL